MEDGDRAKAICELIVDFKDHGISHDAKKGLEKVTTFQDLIGRATPAFLQEFERDLNHQDRGLYFWACMGCLDFDTAVGIIRWHAERIASEKYTELSEGRKEQYTTVIEERNQAMVERDQALARNVELEKIGERNVALGEKIDVLKDTVYRLQRREILRKVEAGEELDNMERDLLKEALS